MENFKELFDQMLGWVTNDMAKGLFIDAYNKIEREKKLAKSAEQQLQQADVSGRSEQLVCDYCGKDKVQGLDHCKCYNGTVWVKKAN